MRSPALPAALAVLLTTSAYAQVTWQPSTPPVVTAENTTWYQNGEPVFWDGNYYYPGGAAQGFNPYQMVGAGSFRGIPLYTDATLEPYSIVFVPLSGGRMQPYERRRTGLLAGTVGSRAPSLPTTITTDAMTGETVAVGPPDFARPYDPMSIFGAGFPPEASAPAPPPAFEPAPIPAVGPAAVGTSGRDAPARPVTTVLPPTGLNAIWVEFNGQRWYGSGESIAYDAARLNQIGSYHGWTVYALKTDPDARTIYIPSIPGRLAPYSRKN
ncbi:MAG TPA: hypothetical protein VFT24_01845 [Vicinamibacterales bacterium]|nr:hypothetical protein [Vicinamibacterales bacterium]